MRVYLAGVQQEQGSKYLLTSFMEGEKSCIESIEQVGIDNFLLDSGAFTFMNTGGKNKDLSAYIDEYIAFINRYDIKYFFELDLYSIVGVEETEKIRRKIEVETGKRSIPVWHKRLGVDYWRRLVREYEYIAIGGIANKDIKPDELPLIKKLVEYAHHKGVRVHGLGFTKTRILKEFKFYSVDSTSWVTGAVRGQQRHIFNGECMKSRRVVSKGHKLDLMALRAFNLSEWVKYQKHMEGI